MQLNLIVIRTDNIEKLSQFYEKIGLHFEYHRHGKGPMHYSTKLKNTVFEIYPLLKNQAIADNSLRLGFEVAHLDNLILDLKKADIVIEKEPVLTEWGYHAVILDLDGRKIELVENN